VSAIGRYEEELLRHLHAEKADLLAAIRDTKKLSDESEAALKATLQTFTANFA
jgi:F-type H+-transporting ATPase subunit alpha